MANAIKDFNGYNYSCPICRDILTYEDKPNEYMYCQSCRDYVYDPESGDNMGIYREEEFEQDR